MSDILESAIAFIRAGLSVLPCQLPDKSPCARLLHEGKWKPFQTKVATETQVTAWFGTGDASVAIGIIGGAVSGNLEIIDFDDPAKVKPWLELVRGYAPGLLLKVIAEKTLRGGCHVFYRCEKPVEKNLKLAHGMRPTDKGEVRKTLIETRGEGGYVVTAPSAGYTLLKAGNTQDRVKTITSEERDILLSCARALDETPLPLAEPPMRSDSHDQGDRPGDLYNQDPNALATLLESWGWTKAYTSGQTTYWRRPGKDSGGISATWNHIPGRFHVFSSNASPLESETTYSPFAVFASLQCGGDFAAAGRQLRTMGYGMRDPMPERPEDPPPPEEPRGRIRNSNLALVPDETPAYERYSRDDPNWEPGMDDKDEDDGAMPTQVTELPRPPDGYPHILDETVIAKATGSEQGLGELAALLFKNRLLYDHSMNAWHRWNGQYWAECMVEEHLTELTHLQRLIQSTAYRKRPKVVRNDGEGKAKKPEGSPLYESLMTASDSLRKLQMRDHVLRYAGAGDDGLGISGAEWDKDTDWLLACKNGILDLRTGEMRSGHPSDRLRRVCPTEYDPTATCPRFEQFIREIMPDQETAEFIKRLFGYFISGSIRDHIFTVFWGPEGRNGKDTLLEAVHNVMGPLVAPIKTSAIMAKNMEPEHDSALMDLRGRRMVWASESGDRQPLDAAKIKQWTGGGMLKGRPPYGSKEIEFMPTHKLVLITNNKPKVSADDTAMWRRIILIPFTFEFVEKPEKACQRLIDVTLPEQLRAEAKGILNWLIQGCLEWQRDGLKKPDLVLAATESYRTEEDMVAGFLHDCVTNDLMGSVSAKDMYDAYVRWAEANAQGTPIKPKTFTKTLHAKGFVTSHTRIGNRFAGIRLVSGDSYDE